jgi:hypothetical protein
MNEAVGFSQQSISKRFRAFRGKTLLFVRICRWRTTIRGAHAEPDSRGCGINEVQRLFRRSPRLL